jgi:DNA-directed RNA polymerase specialized sigma24 family protein
VITLAQIEDLPAAEVGKRMGLTESYARTLLSRALARLARLARGTEDST